MSDRIPLSWVVNDPNDGPDYFATEAEAVAAAEALIEGYLGDTWDEDVHGIFVAKITHGVQETDRIELDDPGWEEIAGGRTDIEAWSNYVIALTEATVWQTKEPS